jgi:hypothetical protein
MAATNTILGDTQQQTGYLGKTTPTVLPTSNFDPGQFFKDFEQAQLLKQKRKQEKLKDVKSFFDGVKGITYHGWEKEMDNIMAKGRDVEDYWIDLEERAMETGQKPTYKEKMVGYRMMQDLDRYMDFSDRKQKAYEGINTMIAKNPEKYDEAATQALLKDAIENGTLDPDRINDYLVTKPEIIEYDAMVKKLANLVGSNTYVNRKGGSSTTTPIKDVQSQFETLLQYDPAWQSFKKQQTYGMDEGQARQWEKDFISATDRYAGESYRANPEETGYGFGYNQSTGEFLGDPDNYTYGNQRYQTGNTIYFGGEVGKDLAFKGAKITPEAIDYLPVAGAGGVTVKGRFGRKKYKEGELIPADALQGSVNGNWTTTPFLRYKTDKNRMGLTPFNEATGNWLNSESSGVWTDDMTQSALDRNAENNAKLQLKRTLQY